MRSFALCVVFAAGLCGSASALSIPEAKLLADNAPVTLTLKCVTYAAPDFFYIEEDSRCMGIRVEKSGHGLTAGMRADVDGTMKTNINRERFILATSAVPNGAASVAPVSMTNLALGGGDWNVSQTKGQRGVSGADGLNNIGLLVTLWGKVERIDATTFTIDDGTGPVKCTIPVGFSMSPGWSYVVVAGISSVYRITTSIQAPILLVRDLKEGDWNFRGDMVFVPAGSFSMGDDTVPSSPVHSVYLSSFWIGRTEVTRGEYRQFVDAGGYDKEIFWSDDGWQWRVQLNRTQPDFWAPQSWPTVPFVQTEDHPVVGISYYEADAFCRWAGGHLPTEAQWEKAACWDGHHRIYPWGDEFDPEKCNNAQDTTYPGSQTAPVGSFTGDISPYGCLDMSGNVREWCTDWYSGSYYSQTPEGGWVDPQGPPRDTYNRAVRGGAFDGGGASGLKCTMRSWDNPDARGETSSGFRLAR